MGQSAMGRHGARALAGAIAVAALSGGCSTTDGLPSATARATFFPTQVDGNLTVTQGGLPGSGSRMSVDDDLDLQEDSYGNFALELDDGPLRLGLQYLPFSYDGSSTLARDVVFHGHTYPAGNDIESDLGLTTWAARVDGALIQEDDFEVRLGVGAYWWQFDLELRDRDAAFDDSRKFSRLLPAVTASSFTGFGDGFGIRLDGAFATLDEGRRLVDASTSVDWEFIDRVHASLGWRWMRYWLNEDTNRGLLDLYGPTIGLVIEL